jgi:radical SAM superfamily enzyme YgiQ (UPF0313 family)
MCRAPPDGRVTGENVTKILLADLAHTHSVSDRSLTVPLGIGYVKAHAVDALGDSVDIRLFKHPERLLAAVERERPDIVGFANYGWNQNLNRAIGRHVRRVLPGALIVAGGPNIDPDTDHRSEFMRRHDYLDGLVIDGGEEPFTELISWHRDSNRDVERLPNNMVWRQGGGLVTTPERPLKKIIKHLPSPYLTGYLDEFLSSGMIPLFETNRGCPFACTFCAWGSASKDLVRRIDIDQALAEIAYVGERSDARNWIVCDANFGILERDIAIAKAIRAVKDKTGNPQKCHIWLAKNVTERNLVIGEILGEMTQPVMAVQSLDDEVLRHIKRDNISIETYSEYQKKFHRIGSRTYSDLIVPLPGETLQTHLAALRTLMDLGVDIIQNHNMRLLAGAETNSRATREAFAFRTRFRLIHGDAGVYRAPDGTEIRTFEYEESLRSTTTMPEADVFYLRKLHFLVDFCWNIEVYKPLLSLGLLYGISPIDVLVKLLEGAENGRYAELKVLFDDFERSSHDEWFDSVDAIEAYFADDAHFQRLLNQEFEKLNIQYSVVVLREFKTAFDRAMAETIAEFGAIPPDVLAETARVAFALFPPLVDTAPDRTVDMASNLLALNESCVETFRPARERRPIRLIESAARRKLRQTILRERGSTLSKILNTQGISLRDLKLAAAENLSFDNAFRRAI